MVRDYSSHNNFLTFMIGGGIDANLNFCDQLWCRIKLTCETPESLTKRDYHRS